MVEFGMVPVLLLCEHEDRASLVLLESAGPSLSSSSAQVPTLRFLHPNNALRPMRRCRRSEFKHLTGNGFLPEFGAVLAVYRPSVAARRHPAGAVALSGADTLDELPANAAKSGDLLKGSPVAAMPAEQGRRHTNGQVLEGLAEPDTTGELEGTGRSGA
jgi:hypothetical protein